MNYFASFDHLATSWSSAAFRASIEGGLLLLIAGAICAALPRVQPAIKCWIWRLAILKVILSFAVAPYIALPVLPPEQSRKTLSAAGPTLKSSETRVVIKEAPMATASHKEITEAVSSPFRLVHFLFMAWFAGASLMLMGLVFQWHRAAALRRQSLPASDSLQTSLNAISAKFSSSTIPLLVSVEAEVPLVTGIFKPVLILPDSLAQTLSEEQLRLIFGHELAHVGRHDLAWNVPGALAKILFWFHPLVWIGLREWHLSQEMACDRLALQNLNGSEQELGELLLDLSLGPKYDMQGAFTLPILQPQTPLKRRLKALKLGRNRSPIFVAFATLLLAMMGFCLVPWKLVAQEDEKSNPSSRSINQNTAPGSQSDNKTSANRLEQQRLYQREIELAGKALEVAERQRQNGAISSTEIIQLQRELVRLEREFASFNNDPEAYKATLETELKLVETLYDESKKRVSLGVESSTELWKLERELLRLKREISNVDSVFKSPVQEEAAARPLRLGPSRAGTIVAVRVRPGQFVQAGEKLFDLDSREAMIQVKSAEAKLAATKATLEAAATRTDGESAVSADDTTLLLSHLKSLDRNEQRQVIATVHRDPTLEKLLADLFSTEQQLAGTLEDHSEKHPEVLRLRAILASLNESVDRRIEGILAGLSTLKEARSEARDAQLKRASESSGKSLGPLRAEIQLAQTELEQASLQLDLCSITAPVGGIVQEIMFQPGERATPDRPVIILLPETKNTSAE